MVRTDRTPTLETPGWRPVGILDAEFAALQQLIEERFGIHLADAKRALLVNRLQKRLRALGLRRFRDYYQRVRSDPGGDELQEMVDCIATNHTYFFREADHFDLLCARILPEVTARIERSGPRDLRVWCAGCATGEEAYTLMIVLLEFFGPAYRAWDAGLLATDLSARALAAAREGLYDEGQLARVPPLLRNKYLRPAAKDRWHVHTSVRDEITFRRLNLMQASFPFRRRFHVIFCRNVMIYFRTEQRRQLVARFERFLEPGGYLVIGHAETLGAFPHGLRARGTSVYRKDDR
jgi:chemotaxis protein methyltransferase CheR